MYFLVYAFFICELQKIFFLRDMMDNQCEIVSLLMQLFMGYIVPCLHFTERENIFSSRVSPTQFLWFGVCVFYLSLPPLFFLKTVFPKTYFIFSIFIGGEIFFNLCGSQGELFLFSLTLLRMFSVYLQIRQSLSIHDKKGRSR